MKRYRNKETGVILAPATLWVEAMYAENPLFEAVGDAQTAEGAPAGKVAPGAGEAVENKPTVDQAAGDQPRKKK